MTEEKPIEPPVISQEPNPFWRETAQTLVGESIASIEEVAKQLISLNGVLETVYFTVITFSDLKSELTDVTAVIYLAPVLLWLLSLVFSVLTLSPKNYAININSSSDSKERFNEILSIKYAKLLWSELFLILSFIALFMALAHFLIAIPASKPP